MNVTTLLTLLTVSIPPAAEAPRPTTVPASNADEPGAKVGKRPYELDWAGRSQPNHPQLVDFEDLTGWRVRCRDGAQARLYRSQEEMIFGIYTGKVVYTGTTPRSAFVIEPPKPIDIPGRFTGVNLWVRGNNWGWINPPRTARTSIRVLVRDAKDEEYAIPVGVNNFDYWFLLHQTLVSPTGDVKHYTPTHSKSDKVIDFPARFTGIEVSGCSNDEPAKVYFDALSFYEIQYKPLTFEPAPAKLPWPTTPDTILPTLKRAVRNEVKAGEKEYELTAIDGGRMVRYRYKPVTGLLSDITVEAGGQRFWPCWKGSIRFDLGGQRVRPWSDATKVKLVRHAKEGQRVVADWQIDCGGKSARYRYELRIKGKSLVVDVTAAGGVATRLDVGMAKGFAGAKAVYFPYLTYGGDWPKVVCSPGKKAPVFLLSLIDYYNSDASVLFGAPPFRDKDCVAYAGGAEYLPKTDGKRNDLRERLFINVSSDVHEVLPNIPNPKCDTGDVAREYLWRNIGHPQREMLAKYKAYGIDKFIACHHEVGWRDAGESFTMRLRAAPRIGDQGFADYGRWLRGLGFRFGTYTNYVDFAPVNSNWNEDDVCLTSDGKWQTAWPRCYALKPLRALEKEAHYAPRIHAKYGTNAQYCDVHTAYTPWGRTDYDARTPGAGMFRTQFNAFARLLHNESKAHHGPVFSEGCHQWFYAGIVDGNYGQMVPHNQGWRIDPLVDFELLKTHPLCTDFGMGAPDMYYPRSGGAWRDDRSRLSPFFDQFHVSTIAFGHIGYLACEWGFDGVLKSYYLLQALQQRYTMVPVERIRYFDGSRLVDASTALVTEAYKRRQIHVRYASGLDVWCNLSPKHDWAVETAGREYRLPPFGFLAHKPDDILAYSAYVDGTRHELVQCKDYLYLDSRGEVTRTPVIAARGAVAVKRDADGAWWVIPATECEAVTISTAWLGCGADVRFAATAHDQSGGKTGTCEVRTGGDEVTVLPVKGAIKYRLTAQKPPAPVASWKLDLPARELIQGETMPLTVAIRLPKGQQAGATKVLAECVRSNGSAVAVGQVGLSDQGQADIELKLPPDQDGYTRCWYRLRRVGADKTQVDERWVDLTAVPVFDVEVHPVDHPYQPGHPVTLAATVRTHRRQPTDVTVTLAAPSGWRAAPTRRVVRLEPLTPTTLSWTMHLPNDPVVEPIRIRLQDASGSRQVDRYVKTRPTDWIAADLTKLPMTTGECLRGGAERSSDHAQTGSLIHVSFDQVGKQRMQTVFMHPPYKTGVGYAFATIPIKLPPGKPRLEFALGFRDGSTSEDGCLFKVIVIDGGRSREIFAKRYAELGKWAHQHVDLSPFAGREVAIKLIADVGPADNSYSDWACWGEPRVTLGEDVMAVEIHTTRPEPAFAPPPAPLKGLTAADLSRIASATLTLETAGVDGGKYASVIYLNGVRIGTTPLSRHDDRWAPASVPVPPAALETLGRSNRVVIRNPGCDYMKVRRFCLRFKLDDGRTGSSYIDVGPYTSVSTWAFAEGKAVSLGADLPTVRLVVPLD